MPVIDFPPLPVVDMAKAPMVQVAGAGGLFPFPGALRGDAPLAFDNLKHCPFILIGLMGKAGAGKDTAAEHLELAHGFERYAFATPIKTMVQALFVECGIAHDFIFERSLKEQPIDDMLGLSARQMMQTLGTEWGRALHPEFWLNAASRALGLGAEEGPVHHRIVISDVRFPNEADWIRAHGGEVWLLERGEAEAVREHVSEQMVDHIAPDLAMTNDGPLADLFDSLDAAMAALEARSGA